MKMDTNPTSVGFFIMFSQFRIELWEITLLSHVVSPIGPLVVIS